MSDCLECGQKVRNSDQICTDCLDVAAAFIALAEFHKHGGKPMGEIDLPADSTKETND